MIVSPRAAGERADLLPDLFGDERHQRMQHAQRAFEHLEQRAAGATPCGGIRVSGLQHGLRQLQVPVAEFVPDEFVHRLRGEVEAIGRETGTHAGHGGAEAAADPAVRDGVLARAARDIRRVLLGVHEHVARRVPQLVAEIAVALDPAEVEADVATHRGERREGEAQRVGAEGRDALRELLARRLLDRVLHLRLHQAGGALGDQASPGRCRR